MSIIADIKELIFARQCIICHARLSNCEKHLCVNCMRHLPRTNFSPMEHNYVERLFWGQLPIEHAVSFLHYKDDVAEKIFFGLKYHDNPDIGYFFGRIMANEYMPSGFFNHIDGIIPIPLSRHRLLKRGYNQCDSIADGIHSITGIPVMKNIVKRTKDNESQTRMMRSDRWENVQNIFHLKKPELIKGKHLLIIDDVLTTGATIISCGKELTKASNVKLSVLTLGVAGAPLIFDGKSYEEPLPPELLQLVQKLQSTTESW